MRHSAGMSARVLASLFAVALLATGTPRAEPAFDRAAWQADYAHLKQELERGYANLAWMASPQSGVDLPALDRKTTKALETATSDAEAKAAITGFVLALDDGHFSALPNPAPSGQTAHAEPAVAVIDARDAATGCAQLGYGSDRRSSFSLPFETLPGFRLEADGLSRAFRSGTVPLPAGNRAGIVRIQNFSRRQFLAECLRAWPTHAALAVKDRDAFETAVLSGWYETLARQLRRFSAEKVAVVIVDIGANSGGDESADVIARMFTARPVRSMPMLMAAAPTSEPYVDEQVAKLREALAKKPNPKAAKALTDAIGFFEARRAPLKSPSCALGWVWREQRKWDPYGCSRLVPMGTVIGAVAYSEPGALGDQDAAIRIYPPAEVDRFRGAWNGPVYVLTDPTSYSAAEMFAAVIHDNGVARTVGQTTGGDGCGFMNETDPVVLPHSGLKFRMPNCVRLRADGSDEVAGVAPDLPVLPTPGESPRARAARVLDVIAGDLRR